MRTTEVSARLAALGSAALVGLAAAGCASDTTALAAASASAVASPGPTGLKAKLLSPKDLPSGWQIDAAPADAPMGSPACSLLNAAAWSTFLPEHAEVDLSRGLSGPYLVEDINAGSSDQASKAWQRLVDGFPHCTTITHTGATGKSTFTISRTELPTYGDSSYAFTLNITITGGVNAAGDIVAARSGNSIVTVYIVGVNSGVSQSVVESLASAAVAKAHT